MSSFILLGLLATSVSKVTASRSDDVFGASVDGGVLKLFGNSFGRPGYNVTYDYVVVGAGNAGATIAARLALDPANYTVALIEPGSFYEIMDGNRTQVPGYNYVNTIEFPLGDQTTPTLWAIDTVPQAGLNDRVLMYPGGMTFGGSTAANYIGYHRATKGTFDQWAEITGDEFWNWTNVYNGYKKSVTFQPPDYTKIGAGFNISYDPTAFDANGGPLHVSYGNYQPAYGAALGEALAASGLSPIDGFNSGRLIGYGTATAAIDTRTATRDSAETSFLQLAARTTSIKLYPQAIGKKILFDEQKKATGVLVQSNSIFGNLEYILSARKEVIVSAGVWHSPQLLMLSGIGPAETLQKYDIDVVADLPGVGQSEFDQPLLALTLNITDATNTQFQVGNPEVYDKVLDEYINHQSGILSGFGTGASMGFEKFPEAYRANFSNATLEYLATFPDDFPEFEIIPLANVPVSLLDVGPYDNLILLNGVLLAPKSRGNMTITSNSIFDSPQINPNWLSDPADVEQAFAGLTRLREIESNWASFSNELSPGPNVTTPEQFKDFILETISFIFHGTSTAKMGPSTDALAVVDSRARVYNVTGLRVVDNSAFPLCPPGHPMSATCTKCAPSLIKQIVFANDVPDMFAELIAESILNGDQ